MSSWATVTLSDCIYEDREPVRTFDGDGLPVYGVTNVEGVAITGVAPSDDRSKYLRLRPNRFIYNPYRVNVGSLGLSSTDQNGISSPAYVIFGCREDLEPKFLLYYLRSHRGHILINFHGNRGTVRAALRFDDLCQVEIPLPPVAEQRRIVARIEGLAAKIEEARGLRREAELGCDTLCRSIIFDKSDGEPTPTPMRELVKLRKPDVFVSAEETYQFAGVYCFGGGVFKGRRKSGAEFAYTRLTRLRSGNFVYPKLMAWEGALAVVPTECDGLVVSTEFPVFEVDQGRVLSETLDVYFRTPSVWPLLAASSTGTNVRRRRLNPEDFLAYKMPLPSMLKQQRLREVKGKVDALKGLQATTASELGAMLPSILDKAFKGEL